MSALTIIGVIYKLLDMLHDYVLHPIFKDEPDEKDLSKIMQKLEQIQKDLKNAKDGK